jgi:hypothetical protein
MSHPESTLRNKITVIVAHAVACGGLKIHTSAPLCISCIGNEKKIPKGIPRHLQGE